MQRRLAELRWRRLVVDSSQPLASECYRAMKILDIPKSGRCGDFVFYMRGNKQCRRRYVVPRDPRTAGQLRARAAFGAASRTWSHSLRLTQEEREAWRTAAASIQSRPRLAQSGPLTGQLHYVGRMCAQGRLSGEEKARRCERNGEGQQTSLQALQIQRVARSTWEHSLSAYRATPGRHRQALGCARAGWHSLRGCVNLAPRIGRAVPCARLALVNPPPAQVGSPKRRAADSPSPAATRSAHCRRLTGSLPGVSP
jgi:hypothetical protein